MYTKPMSSDFISIDNSIANYLNLIHLSRSFNTYRSYSNSLKTFSHILKKNGVDPEKTSVEKITEDYIGLFLNYLKKYSPATEQMYLAAVSRYYQFLAAEDLVNLNLQRLQLIIQSRARRQGIRLPQFPMEDIQKVISYAIELHKKPYSSEAHKLINYRDSAFLVTLADTGLRVHEACSLRRGDMDWNESKALIIGKGDHQAIIRFSKRACDSIKRYLKLRSELDGRSGRPLPSLPMFSRHDKGAGKKVKPIGTATGRNIVKARVKEVLGDESFSSITPHSFRHFFVSSVLKGSGGNLKLAQELARHKNIQVTQRYAHLSNDELDRGYYGIFEE